MASPLASLAERDKLKLVGILTSATDLASLKDRLIDLIWSDSESSGSEAEVEEKVVLPSPIQTRSKNKKKGWR